jgi:hypothetical protein
MQSGEGLTRVWTGGPVTLLDRPESKNRARRPLPAARYGCNRQMDFRIDGQFFSNVRVPLLWGSRAILRDGQGHLSIVNLESTSPRLEVIDDKPASGANVVPTTDGYVILDGEGGHLYSVNPTTRSLTPIGLRLPPVTFGERELRLGAHVFEVNMVAVGVGILATESGIALGGPLPLLLGQLRV